jgi:hypothetical protein
MIECIRYKPVNKGALLGFADLYIPQFDLEIYGCGVFQKDTHVWITMPSKETINDQGLKQYFSHLRFRDRTRMDSFSHEALQAIRPWMEAPRSNTPIMEPPPF